LLIHFRLTQNTYSIGCNSFVNINLQVPKKNIYPKKSSADAPYSLSEVKLREAIQIPPGFSNGDIPPLIMVPGTGSTGCLTFGANFIKQFTDSRFADPVWLNIPDFLYNDAQQNAEYVAYAINYISAISDNKNVSVIAWSQGNIDTQWAFKFWPSTRKIVSDLVSISPDFHGTTVSSSSSGLGLDTSSSSGSPPSILQQNYTSQFIAALRANGGDSAFVVSIYLHFLAFNHSQLTIYLLKPTTSLFSSTDEIVQPQSGTNASAYIKDVRGVGVSNNELQVVCAGYLPGVYATHEGMLYNALSYALAVDALTHPGPGRTSRINLRSVCNEVASPGLSVADIITTESKFSA
jgi:hypothetical protein